MNESKIMEQSCLHKEQFLLLVKDVSCRNATICAKRLIRYSYLYHRVLSNNATNTTDNVMIMSKELSIFRYVIF